MINRILILVGALLVADAPASAQAPAAGGRLPVAIVLLDELPIAGAKAVLIRRKDMRPQNIVLVTERTSAGDLARGMATLAASRRSRGDQVKVDMVAPIAANTATNRSGDYLQAEKDLRELRTARTWFIDGVGERRAVFSHLRPMAPRKSKG